jgi:hypothetical protein
MVPPHIHSQNYANPFSKSSLTEIVRFGKWIKINDATNRINLGTNR